jgi:uncharacterized membrane protein YkoI
MFFIKTFRELKRLRIENKQLKEALADNNEELKLYEREMAKIERDDKVTHYHVNAKMLCADFIKRAARTTERVQKKPVVFCLISYNDLKAIANSHIK